MDEEIHLILKAGGEIKQLYGVSDLNLVAVDKLFLHIFSSSRLQGDI